MDTVVYIVVGHLDYEGGEVLGVWASLAEAERQCESYLKQKPPGSLSFFERFGFDEFEVHAAPVGRAMTDAERFWA